MEYFVAAAEQLNFTRAAKKCFISQTAMTLQIQSLEEKIGVPLFVRDKHHVELTAAGKVYLNEARAILVRAEEAAKLARTAAEGIAGELTIGFIRGYEQSRFSETLRSFHEAYPNISIHLLRENMSALYELLDNGTCDLAFNLSLYTQNYEDLKHRFLKRFPMMAVLYPGHTLAGDSHLMYRDLAREDFIIMQPQGRSNDEAEAFDHLNRLRAARGVAKANQALGLMNLVEAEFRREFIGEGQLFWFYKRQNRTQIPSSKDFNNMITMEKSFYLFDLPQDEKDKRGME